MASAGSKITFNKVSRNQGRQQSLLSTQFDESVQATFDICKNPDMFDTENMEISYDEFKNLMRWLNRNKFLKFHFINEDDKYNERCYFNASFNIDKVTISEMLYGLELTMFTDKPFGYGREEYAIFNINSSQSHMLIDKNDEIGYTFPKIKITCLASGTLTLTNSLTRCYCQVKNCVATEIITIDGESKTIHSSITNHNVCEDFNYDFFSIGNTFDTRINNISSSMPCKIEISYNPIIKNSP